jgi:peptidoglycan hydrolase-like protein with peptidoglycan-binding domain
MKGTGFIILALAVSICLFGCGKKQQTLEEMQEPMSIEALGTATTTPAQPLPMESKIQEVKPQVVPMPEGLPPSVSSKPTTQEIQSALKNTGYYTGNIDGKIGPMTKKAIEEFQKANSLKADGKVGSKTWEALSKYLNIAPEAPKKNKKR